MSDINYLQDQHILIAVKGEDGQESYGKSFEDATDLDNKITSRQYLVHLDSTKRNFCRSFKYGHEIVIKKMIKSLNILERLKPESGGIVKVFNKIFGDL